MLAIMLNNTTSCESACRESIKDLRSQEVLDIVTVNDLEKLLFRFSFDFEHPAELNKIFGTNYIFSRSVLESIFLAGNATFVRFEASCGSINPTFLKE